MKKLALILAILSGLVFVPLDASAKCKRKKGENEYEKQARMEADRAANGYYSPQYNRGYDRGYGKRKKGENEYEKQARMEADRAANGYYSPQYNRGYDRGYGKRGGRYNYYGYR